MKTSVIHSTGEYFDLKLGQRSKSQNGTIEKVLSKG